MKLDDADLVPVFMPALIVFLVHAEDKRGDPLTQEEVHSIRDAAPCIMMKAEDANEMEESRGYPDIDPENCWHDWQMARREMGRKPDLDPGPRFDQVQSSDPDYRKAIEDAHASIEQFRSMLPADGSPRTDALIKTKLTNGDESAIMWLHCTALDGDDFTGELFEVPDTLPNYDIGTRLKVETSALLDWMVKDNGRLHGGFSLRYHRARLPASEQADYDNYVGVTEYV